MVRFAWGLVADITFLGGFISYGRELDSIWKGRVFWQWYKGETRIRPIIMSGNSSNGENPSETKWSCKNVEGKLNRWGRRFKEGNRPKKSYINRKEERILKFASSLRLKEEEKDRAFTRLLSIFELIVSTSVNFQYCWLHHSFAA